LTAPAAPLPQFLLSRDLAIVRAICDDVTVMVNEEVVECRPADRLQEGASDLYSKLLIEAQPRLARQPRRFRAEGRASRLTRAADHVLRRAAPSKSRPGLEPHAQSRSGNLEVDAVREPLLEVRWR
jgi:ABC-type dipeptide/oligopeptide/nickel transport system ATPase component